VLITAHNEETSIAATIDSVLAQTRHADRIVVAADNCSDATVAIARGRRSADGRRAVVFETIDNRHKKSGALNQAWARTKDTTDLYVCIDADTVLPINALADWEAEFASSDELAGCSAKFTMLSTQEMVRLAEAGIVPPSVGDLPMLSFRERMWCRIQKAEFAQWTDKALARKGRCTTVLAGTACMVRSSALDQVAALELETWEAKYGDGPDGSIPERPEGPWTYQSQVEDYYLTHQLRSLGWVCRVSADVRAYTGAMLSMRTLWAQRMKWQVGTVSDLRALGVSRRTRIDWWQQLLGMLSALLRATWILLILSGLLLFGGHLHMLKYWWVFPLGFALCDVREAWRLPHRTWADVFTAAIILPQELFAWMRAAWFTCSWVEVLTGRTRDRWALQIAAERG
jgi:cellulose synthase/poly-beta-1,6-N-acetylglucosamine synthase-like glycosyltransferase